MPGVDRGEEAKGLNPGVLQYLKSRKWIKEERRRERRKERREGGGTEGEKREGGEERNAGRQEGIYSGSQLKRHLKEVG